MVRSGWAIGILLVLSARTNGGDHVPRERPANASQPPGASFERHVSRQQKTLLVKDTLRATGMEFAHHPVHSTVFGVSRLVERAGVLLAERIPHSPWPLGFQDPEAGGPCTPARITPLFGSRPAYQALLDLIGSARCRVDLMMYSWDDDTAGRTVAEALIERARSGILVRLMIDRGAYVTGEDNARVPEGYPTYIDDLRAAPNVQVIESPDPGFVFDHRKLAVIDDRMAWSGGMVLTNPSLFRWHNFAYLAEGAIVPQFAALFRERWEQLGGSPVPACPESVGVESVSPNASVRMVRTDLGHRSLKEAVYGAIDRAKHHIYLENCYFSDEVLAQKLVDASHRGVDVRAVLTMRGDVELMNKFAAIMSNRLLKGGARVYLYPAMTHVKALSVDGTLAYIGTGNFDDLSLRNNREVALTVREPDLIRQIDQGLFLKDMADSQELRALLPRPKWCFLLEATSILY
ncbi:phospholipase D-like domain-containing protein [Tundrisphaera lichenicola]|uniref:phospholipase D-like domain-containing protein n=1 Tax=Tundrisphaera lichenicola TaxID=2029860 RepID=UPI003EC0AA2F